MSFLDNLKNIFCELTGYPSAGKVNSTCEAQTQEETKKLTEEEAASPSRQEAVEKWVTESLRSEFVPLSFCDKKWPEILPCSDTLPVISNNIAKHFPANKHSDSIFVNSMIFGDLLKFQNAGRGQLYWDRFFLGLARYVSTASKDPSTQVGAVIVDGYRRVISVGYNGFARGVDDSPERYTDRETKLKYVVHAETNAVSFATQPLRDCIIYTWPFPSCSRCSSMLINVGIKRCVAPPMSDELKERWGDDIECSKTMFGEAGVQFDIVELP